MSTASPGAHLPEAGRARWFESLLQDMRYALRGLRKTPGFTVTVILVLALGVGANASMYTLVDRLFFREPSGIVNPEQVVTATEVYSQGGYALAVGSNNVDAIRKKIDGLAEMALQAPVYQGIDRDTGPRVMRVTANYFPMLGVRMARGRAFAPDEGADSLPVAVVSYRYWQRQLRGDSAVLGSSIELARTRYTVIGVADRDFGGISLEATDVWLPMSSNASGAILLRLKPGATRKRVDAAMTVAVRQGLSPNLPKGYTPPTMQSSPLQFGRQHAGFTQLEVVTRVAGVAAIILLVAIANVATLLLMRATRRRREIAVRLALGVSRSRLMRQLIVEGALLSLAAGCAALIVGVWGGAVARARLLGVFYRLTYPLIDWHLVGFTLAVAMAAGMVASLVPAIQASSPDLTQSLKAGTRGHFHRSWFRGSLVVAQAALSVVLVVGAGLFVRSLHNIRGVALGVDVDQLVVAAAQFGRNDSAATYIPAMLQEAERLSSVPGVESAALSLMPPLEGVTSGRMFRQNGDTMVFGKTPAIGGNAVGPGYFKTVGIRILDGRDVSSADGATSPRVILISQSAAREGWPGQRAVGQCVLLNRPSDPCATIIGVVSDANLVNIKPEPPFEYYMPITQDKYIGGLSITMRAPSENRAAILQTARQDLARIVPASAFVHAQDLRSALDPRYAQWTEGAAVFSAMGILALIVAAIGMYSIIAYSVSQRMHEMGIRVALGARRGQVMRPVVLGGLKLALIGVALGVGASLAAGKLVASLLYATSPRDPLVMAGAALVLLLASVAASIVPARRAARVDPVIALRAE